MSIWQTLSRRFKTEVLNDLALKPYYIAFTKVDGLITAVRQHRSDIEKPGTLSQKGVLESVRAYAEKDVVPELRRHQHRLDQAGKMVQDRYRSLGVPKPADQDMTAAMLRQEARAHLKSLDEAGRAQLLLNDPDPITLQALFEAPGYMSGVSEELRGAVEKQLIEAASPIEVKRIELERETLGVVAAAIEAGVNELRDLAGFEGAGNDFDKWMEKASEGVEKEIESRNGQPYKPDLDTMIEQAKLLSTDERFKVTDALLDFDPTKKVAA